MRASVSSVARVGITVAVGLIGAAAGFTHTHDAAIRAGQHGWLAWADAVVIECMVVVAGLQYVDARKTEGNAALPGFVLVTAFLIQMGAQVSGAPANFAGWLFAAIPALGCLVCIKFGLRSAEKAPSEVAPSEVDGPATAAQAFRVEEPEPVREIAPAAPAEQVRPEPVPVMAAAWPPSS